MAIAELVDEALEMWAAAGAEFPAIERRYTEAEQRERERTGDECLARVDAAVRDLRRRKLSREEAQAKITAATVELTSCALDLRDPYVDWLLGEGFGGVSTELAQQARRMDRSVRMIDILQAARNAWTACGLQELLGCALQLSPAIFAYSMLYPYSDNYLDDKGVPREAKVMFNSRFRRRLEGERFAPANGREATIWELVGMIEAQFARQAYPQVYESLLAIHAAQQESIQQMRRAADSPNFDVLRLTFTKGGTSVLADACLAAGCLSRDEARFAFQWGVVLQLGDDLQDLRSDGRDGSLTLYTQAARHEPLDALTNRTLQFGRRVMAGMDKLRNGKPILKELLRRSSQMLLIRSAAGVRELYTGEYLEKLERYSPFGFEFMRRREQELASRTREYGRLFEELIRVRENETKPGVRTFRNENVLTIS